MKQYLYDYIKEINLIIKDNKRINDDIINEHLTKIQFFQHERLIHLIVTLFYALIFLVFTALGFVHFIFLFVAFILFIFLLFYIVHYFRLENGVQYLYKQYDEMKKTSN